jgi:hypothetical protein
LLESETPPHSGVLSKQERLKVFFKRLASAAAAETADDALALLTGILNCVEDEFSGVPFKPEPWSDDGRMYAPTGKNERSSVDRPWLRRFRSAKHITLIGMNGAIRIEDLTGTALFEKAGSNGRHVSALAAKKG